MNKGRGDKKNKKRKQTNQNIRRHKMRVKMAIVGVSRAGKTSLADRFKKCKFINPDHTATVGVDKSHGFLKYVDTDVYIELWDLAGQDNFKEIAHIFYSQAQAIIIVYDLSRPETKEDTLKWCQEVSEKHPEAFLALVANKKDKVKDLSQLFEMMSSINIYGIQEHFTVSALENDGVDQMFMEVIFQTVIRKIKRRRKYRKLRQLVETSGHNSKLKRKNRGKVEALG